MRASLVAQLVRNLLVMQEIWVQFLDWDDPLEEGMATHSSMLAWRIPRTVQSMRSQRAGYSWATNAHTHTHKWLKSCKFHTRGVGIVTQISSKQDWRQCAPWEEGPCLQDRQLSKAGEGEEREEGTGSRRVQEGKLTLLSGHWATAIVVMRIAPMANLYTKWNEMLTVRIVLNALHV